MWGNLVVTLPAMLHTWAMTMPDLGPERPGDPSETRQLVERGRTQTGAEVNGSAFVLGLVAVLLAIAGLVLLLR